MNKRLLSMCVMAMMGVLLTAGKEVMAFLPNFEPVTLLIVLFTLSFGPVAMGAVCVFLLLEGLLYGFGSWWVMYLYIWHCWRRSPGFSGAWIRHGSGRCSRGCMACVSGRCAR